MTSDQREILISNIQGHGGVYTIRGVEYPSFPDHGFSDGVCVKITTQMVESDEIFVDWYTEDGRTVGSRSFFAGQS